MALALIVWVFCVALPDVLCNRLTFICRCVFPLLCILSSPSRAVSGQKKAPLSRDVRAFSVSLVSRMSGDLTC